MAHGRKPCVDETQKLADLKRGLAETLFFGLLHPRLVKELIEQEKKDQPSI